MLKISYQSRWCSDVETVRSCECESWADNGSTTKISTLIDQGQMMREISNVSVASIDNSAGKVFMGKTQNNRSNCERNENRAELVHFRAKIKLLRELHS